MQITTQTDMSIDEYLAQLREVLTLQREIANGQSALVFLSIKDLAEMSGWNIKTVQNIFNRPDFPVLEFGKEKKVELHAAIKYFSVARRKDR